MALEELLTRDDLPEDVREAIKQALEARGRSEEEARASEERQQGLFETMAQGVVYQAADGQITSANPAAEAILGLTFDQMSGRTSMDPSWKAIHEDGSPYPGDEHPSMVALRTGGEVRDVVMGVFHPQRDEHRWISITAVPRFRAGQGSPDHVYTTFDDITDRRRAEQALKESEGRYRELVDAMPDGLAVADEKGLSTYVNDQFCEILGCTRPEAVGRPFADFLEVDGLRAWTTRPRGAQEQEGGRYVAWAVKKGGERRRLLVSPRSILDAEGEPRGSFAVLRDVTEQERAEKILRRTVEHEKAVSRISRTLTGRPSGVFDELITEVLGIIGELVKADRCYVLQLSDDETQMDRSHAWSAEGVELSTPERRPSAVASLPWIAERLRRPETVRIPRVSALPPEADSVMASLQEERVQSLLLAPISYEGSFFGALGLETMAVERAWGDDDVAFLEVVGEILVSALKRWETEQALQEEERRYKLAASAGKVGVWDLDVASGEFYIDPRLKALLGYTDRELANDLELWFHSVHPDDREDVKAAFSAFVDGRSPEFESEHRMLRRDRSVCWFLARGIALRGVKGRATRVLGTNVDITARRRAEEQLRENEARQRGLVETIPDGLAAVDEESVSTFVNQQLCEILGYPREEVLGRRLTDFLDTDGLKTWAAQRKRRQQKQGGQYVLRTVRKDGSRRRLRVSEKPMSDAHGFWSGSLVVMRDITDDLRSEETLRQRTRDLGERVKELGCLYGISRLERLEGASLDEVLQGAVDLVPRSWQYPDIAGARLVLEGREYRTDNFRESAWMQTAPVLLHGQPIGSFQVSYLEEKPPEAEGPFLKEERDLVDSVAEQLGHFVERQRSEQRLRESEERYASFVRSFKGIAFQGDLHFRPIFFDGAVREITGHEAEEFLDGDLRWDQLIHPDDLPDVLAEAEKIRSRPDYSTDQEYRIVRKDGATRWVLATLQNVCDESGKPFRVQGTLLDITESRRAAEALLESSLRYERLLKSIAAGVWVLDEDWRYTVANRHAAAFVGLPEGEILGRKITELVPEGEASPLFKMLQAVMTTGNPSSLELELVDGHTGLHEVRAYPVQEGVLCLAFEVAERRREASSGGAVEPIQASRERVPFGQAARVTAAESPGPPGEAKGVILLIDDEEIVRETTSEMLEQHGLVALTAESEAAGIALYRDRRERIDLVILDLSQPGPGGAETLRTLRQIDPEARVILSSGFGREDATRGLGELGLAGFIQKPYKPETLLAEIDRLLRDD